MSRENAEQITGVFVQLYRAPIRLVFRRRIDCRRDSYHVFKPWDKIEAVREVIFVLSNKRSDFTQRLLDIDDMYYKNSSHRTRRYVHIDRSKLYPGRTDLEKKYSRQFGEVWIGTNLNTSGMLQVIRECCEAAEVEFGSPRNIKW